jgi:hypothetical protein
MSRKFVWLTAVFVCFALAFAPLMAGRTVDRQGDRSKESATERAGSNGDISGTFDNMTRQVPSGIRNVQPATTSSSKATSLLSEAMQQDGSDAIATLGQILDMNLASSVENDKLLSDVYTRLGELYEGNASKQVNYYALALQLLPAGPARDRIESRVTALGGNVSDLAFAGNSQQTNSSRDLGVQDNCFEAVALSLPASLTGLNIDNSFGTFGIFDYEWFSFDVPGPEGYIVNLNTEASAGGSGLDDTLLVLYSGCNADGTGTTVIGRDDDGGVGLTSNLTTDCLTPGTYYVRFGAFESTFSPRNIVNGALDASVVATCVPPSPDGFEPDGDLVDRSTATGIGYPTSIPPHANGWGRAKKEIQSHSIFPAGDIDNMSISLTRNENVHMETAGQFGTFFNDFTSAPLDGDTIMYLQYDYEPDYGGRCNDQDAGFANVCATGADCPPSTNPVPGFPDCIPYFFFTSWAQGSAFQSQLPLSLDGVNYWNPLIVDDDSGPLGTFASQIDTCLPRTGANSPSLTAGDSFNVMVRGWSSQTPLPSSLEFDYEVQVKNQSRCNFESEPNNSLEDTNALTLGSPMNGIYDFSAANPFADADVYSFDVDSDMRVVLETTSWDSLMADTALELYIGPDDAGNFYFVTGNEDGGAGWLSLLDLLLPNADEFLGNTSADANWLVNVTANYLNPNFIYTLNSAAVLPPTLESEPNDDAASANAINTNETVLAAIGVSCDYDWYVFSLSTTSSVSIGTTGLDTAIEVYDSGLNDLACDDDGGAGLESLITGCLAAGDYYVAVRGWSTTAGAYELTVSASANSCTPGLIGDGLFTCSAFGSCP